MAQEYGAASRMARVKDFQLSPLESPAAQPDTKMAKALKNARQIDATQRMQPRAWTPATPAPTIAAPSLSASPGAAPPAVGPPAPSRPINAPPLGFSTGPVRNNLINFNTAPDPVPINSTTSPGAAPGRSVIPVDAGRALSAPYAAPAPRSTALVPTGQPRGFTAPYAEPVPRNTLPALTADKGRAMTAPAQASAATIKATGDYLNPKPATPIPDGRYGAPANPPLNSEFVGPRPGQATPGPVSGGAREMLNRAGPGLQAFTGAGGQPSATAGRLVQGAKGFASGVARLAGKVATPLAVGMEGLDVARVALDPNASGIDVATQTAQGAGRLGAAGVGAAIGATAGSVVPVVGTVLGGLAGGALGYLGADKAIEAGRSMAGVDPASPASRAPDLVQSPMTAQTAPQPAKPASQTVASPFAGATPAPASPAAAALAAAPAIDPNAPTSNVTRVGNSYSGGNVAGDITINGQAPRNGGMVSVQNQQAFDNLKPLYPAQAEAARGFQPAARNANPGLSIMPDTGGFGILDKGYQERRAAGMPLTSITANRAQRSEAAAQLARIDQRDLNAANNANAVKRQGMADESARYGQELGNDTTRRGQDIAAAGQMANTSIAQYRAGLDGQELEMKRTTAGFGNRAAARIEALQAAYDKAPAADRAGIAEQLRVMTGKDRPDANRFTVVPGGQEWDATANAAITRPAQVINNQTGEFVNQGQSQAKAKPQPEGTRLTGKDGKAYVVKNGVPVLL